MDRRLEVTGHLRRVDASNRRVTVTVSTSKVARDGAIVEAAGWDLAHYKNNPVVLWGHDDRSLPIARAVETKVQNNELVQTHEFARHDRAVEVWEAIKGGYCNAVSVRWLPGKTEQRRIDGKQVLVYTRGHQLLEVSWVSVPADPDAVVARADGRPMTHYTEAAAFLKGFEQGRSPLESFLIGFTKGH